ncbi:MAG TPA: hypothetical protein VJR92_06105 [Gemmatimonadaceae bacterium]|nr:hypothetical protein [Gemmatimonadaceae bacterium]
MQNAYVAVFLGAGIGGVLRHIVNQVALRFARPDLPLGTFAGMATTRAVL